MNTLPKDVRKIILSKLSPRDYLSAIESSRVWPKDDRQYEDKKEEYTINTLNSDIDTARKTLFDEYDYIVGALRGETKEETERRRGEETKEEKEERMKLFSHAMKKYKNSDAAKAYLRETDKLKKQLEDITKGL